MEIDRQSVRRLDPQNLYSSAERLANQCQDAWEKAMKIQVPDNYCDIDNVVMCGMGGSGLGARVIESVYADDLKVPLLRINSYNLPGFVNENSLVICSSYSGTTEETIENAKQAITRKARWMAIGTGNTLIDMAIKNDAPYYQINPIFNPSNQPRMGIGYSIVGQIILAGKAGLINFTGADIDQIKLTMQQIFAENRAEVDMNKNMAKQTAVSMQGKVIFYVSAQHLVGATHVINNQQNESAKSISVDVQIPELNHHLMEGLKNPASNRGDVHFVFIDSTLYSERVKQRFVITKEVVTRQGLGISEISLKGLSRLSQVFELIQFGSLMSLYLSVLYNQNPAPIPWVDYFKERLGQPLGK